MQGTLIRIQPWSPAAGARVSVYVGAAANALTMGADGYEWQPAIVRLPRYTLQTLDEGLTGRVQSGRGDCAISLNMIGNVPDVGQLQWVGAPIEIYRGDGMALADTSREFLGRVVSGVPDPDTNIAALSFEVDIAAMDVDLLTAEYTGGGGINGDPEFKGKLKPAGFGSPKNVPVEIIDTVNNIAQIDGYGHTVSVTTLYENLADFGPSVGDFASYATLVAAVVPEGRWATCIAQGLIRLGAEPAGVITCDPVFASNRPGQLMRSWLQNFAGISATRIRTSDFDALDVAVPYPVSFWTNSQQNVLDLVQRMCASCNATPIVDFNGIIGVTRVPGGGELMTLDRFGGNPLVTAWRSFDQPTPWWKLKMAAAKVYRVHTEAEIAYEDDIVPLGDYDATATYRQGNVVRWTDGAWYLYINAVAGKGVAPPTATHWELYESAPDATAVRFADGQSLESLKPLEAGANVTETRYSTGFYGEGALARANQASWGSQVSGRPTELTDGRVSTGLSPSGGAQGGLQGAGALLSMAEVFRGLAGTNIAPNPEFTGGSLAGWSVYNNAGGSKVSISAVGDSTAPNGSGIILRVLYAGGGTPNVDPTPGFGGAVQQLFDGGGTSKPGFYARGSKVLWKVIAKLSAGRTLNFATNGLGTPASVVPLTSMAGTGQWETYVFLMTVGQTGSYGATGYLYVTGGANASFSWDIARFDFIDLTSAEKTFMGRTMMDEDGVARFKNDLVTLLGYSLGFQGEGNLARKSTVGPADIVVPSLSAIAANLGVITAGFMQSPSGSTQIDLTNARQLFNNGAVMLAFGVGFGSTNQFLMWFGPTQASYSACTEANAVFYLKTNGSAYFGGSLSAGTLTTKAQTSSLSATASVDTGAFGSNGDQIQVAYSYAHRTQDDQVFAATSSGLASFNSLVASLGATSSDGGFTYDAAGTTAEAVDVILAKNGTQVATFHLTGDYTWHGVKPVVGDSAGSGRFIRTMGGSQTFNDPVKSTANRSFSASIANRNLVSFTAETQNLAVVATEQ